MVLSPVPDEASKEKKEVTWSELKKALEVGSWNRLSMNGVFPLWGKQSIPSTPWSKYMANRPQKAC